MHVYNHNTIMHKMHMHRNACAQYDYALKCICIKMHMHKNVLLQCPPLVVNADCSQVMIDTWNFSFTIHRATTNASARGALWKK